MVTKKNKKINPLDLFSKVGLLGLSLNTIRAHAEGEGPGGGGTDQQSVTEGDTIPGTDVTATVGETYGVDYNGDGLNDVSFDVTPQPSTPFLVVWNGEKFVHENDFLFGKPNTVFANYKVGLKKYEQGIGGDTYLLSDQLKTDKDGNLKMQIRELEPEESYIDKFEIGALDLKESEHYVVDGNLVDSYIFDTQEAKAVAGEMHHYHSKQNVFTAVEGAYTSLTPKDGESITMQAGDELVIRVSKAQLDPAVDTYVLVDSHFRDWSLGDQVPFSRLERFMIQSVALGQRSATAVAGAAMLASIAFVGITKTDSDTLAKLLNVPHSYADYTIGDPTRSLVISAGDSFGQTYLQTLFPRYVQAAQEVVRIPKDVIANLKDEFLTLRVKATKKHKVRAAFAFQGTAHIPKIETLSLQKLADTKTGADYTEQMKEKNGVFLHTIPGDVLDLVIKDTPKVANTKRRYVLRANGFYTRMSAKTTAIVGKNWLERLAPEDRNLLKGLRLS
ncbi:hypothetical protein A2392_02360 [Candidatus Kaiserbacteria bacterium RIFOXYB1_FULL_46_14]|uniref:Uncharacterized protein n=1 Tax=Candidatus Kaiserbacteria bacterium RIFOXYB1_FULL_46_14 TaxID=1798531 RepID=A0A1F6FIA7_9BACT|nr:MAG: hypothetical protein A2392_02360 [Candidatus Kaiserbacteria bacterium RIFOXYB1_FULL_46_14]